MTWVLLRGLTRESRHWGDFTQQLATATGQTVLTLDLPGNGALFADTSPASVSSLLDALRQQMAEQGVALPVNLLATSLGGMVATHWAQRYPYEVARLVLINTSMRPFSSLTERLRPASWIPFMKIAMHWHHPDQGEQIESAIHQLTCQQTLHLANDIAQWSGIRRSAPVSTANACPVLVLSSKGDDLVNPVCSTLLASRWQLAHHQHT